MKKQIFILVFLVVATFASVTNLYAQSCGDALHPIAGKKYTYGISVSPAGGTFNWYVVTSADLMPGTSTKADNTYLIGGTGYNAPGTGTSTVDITWSSKAVKEALANTTKFYLVVNYAMTGCTDNLKAYAVTPVNLFQILVENANSAGTVWDAAAATAGVCRSAVVSAKVNGTGIDYDYGSNALYLKITANYFTTSWTPKIDITALKASLNVGQTITSIEYSTTTTFTGTSNFDLGTGVATTPVAQVGTSTTDGTDQLIYVKVVITDGKFEGTGDQNVAFNVSAVDASGNPDVDLDSSCVALATDPDNVKQLLKGRPAITSTTAVTIPSAGTGVFMLGN